MKIKLVYVDLFVGEVVTREPFDPRPGDYLTVHAKDWENTERDFVYRIVKKDYQCHGVAYGESRTLAAESDCLVLHVDPANTEASGHLHMLLSTATKKKHPYTISCPDCKRDMLKMHEMKGIETWRCSSCQQDIIQSKEKGIIEVLPIPPGQI